jgi:1-phosphatidylinositol-4-phosphate 5-kinase
MEGNGIKTLCVSPNREKQGNNLKSILTSSQNDESKTTSPASSLSSLANSPSKEKYTNKLSKESKPDENKSIIDNINEKNQYEEKRNQDLIIKNDIISEDEITFSLNDIVFIEPEKGTPAAAALAANAAVKVTKIEKGIIKKFRSLKRPKMKNLNIVKQIKKHSKVKSGKKKARSKNFKGKVIAQGIHELYTLTAGMMLGMRCSIGRDTYHLVTSGNSGLILDDFNYVEKTTFPPDGYNKPPHRTPPHSLAHTFKFKSYAPKVFKRIRNFFDIDSIGYMLSVCGNYNYLEFMSNSKSGQFFFYSHDGKYMIKTQTKEENKFMKRILPHYFQYISENPDTLLVRILGMHRVKMYHLRRKVHFVIMASVFDTPQKIHTIYDLKGSIVGRQSTPKEKSSGGVLKDQDLLDSNRKFKFGDKKEKFMEQIKKDSDFLATLNIMDYSLLIGIHDRNLRDVDHIDTNAQSHSNTPFRRGKPTTPHQTQSTTPVDISGIDSIGDNAVIGNSVINVDNTKINFSFSDNDVEKTINPIEEESDDVGGKLKFPVIDYEDEDEEDYDSSSDKSDNEGVYIEALSDNSDNEVDEGDEGDSIWGDDEIRNRTLSFNEENNFLPEVDNSSEGEGALGFEGGLLGQLFTSTNDFSAIRKESEDSSKSTVCYGPGHSLKHPWTSRRDSGINSCTAAGRGGEIYYCGVIDILQQYNMSKRAENFFKGFLHDRNQISAVDSKAYSERFVKFMNDNIE